MGRRKAEGFTDSQFDLLKRMMPMGLVDRRLVFEDEDGETKLKKEMLARMIEKGFVEERIFKAGKRKTDIVKRYCLTEKGIKGFLAMCKEKKSPLCYVKADPEPTLRGNANQSYFLKMIRVEDVSTFFVSIGVETSYTAALKDKMPYVLGLPHADINGTIPSLDEVMMDAFVKCAQSENWDRMRSGKIFLSSKEIPQNRPVTSNRIKKRSPNNSIGILLNLDSKYAFIVFHFLKGSKLAWKGHGYESFSQRLSGALSLIDVKRNYSGRGQITDAIILCRTVADMRDKALSFVRTVRFNPFGHVFAFNMTFYEGDRIRILTRDGANEFIERAVSAAKGKVNLQEMSNGDLEINGKLAFVGTYVDFNQVQEIYDIVKEIGDIPYVIHLDWQRSLYVDIIYEALDRKTSKEDIEKYMIAINCW